MAVEIGPIYRRSPIPSLPREIREQTPTVPSPEKNNVGRPDYAALLRLRKQKSYRPNLFRHMEERPLEPLEPDPFSLSPHAWAEYVIKRDAARAYALENDLRGVPFS